jgi:hypothetical protein
VKEEKKEHLKTEKRLVKWVDNPSRVIRPETGKVFARKDNDKLLKDALGD